MADYKQKSIDRNEVVAYLSRAFSRAVYKAVDSKKIALKAARVVGKDGKKSSTPLYEYQVEFAYLVDHIQRGPTYIAPKYIQEANDLIASIES